MRLTDSPDMNLAHLVMLSGPEEFISFRLTEAISQRRLSPDKRMLEVVSISIFVHTGSGTYGYVNSDALRCLEGVVQGMSDSVRELQIEFVHFSQDGMDLINYVHGEDWSTLRQLLLNRCRRNLKVVHFTACNRSGGSINKQPMHLESAARHILRSSFESVVPLLTFE